MKASRLFKALALPALLALGTLPAQAREVQTQPQPQPQVQTPQQTQQAQQAREQAEAYLRKEESAATSRQAQSTDRANQDASVADETAGHSDAGRPARSTSPNAAPPPSYGPTLNPRQPQTADPARKDPAEVHDETDSLTRQPAQPQAQQPPQKQKQAKQDRRTRQAWQPESPMAPRSLNAPESAAIGTGMVPIPPPTAAPQALTPTSRALNSCVGSACTDAAGGTYNLGPTGSGVSSSGRLCSRTGTTVQCF
jgi:hypothetical protein